MESSCTCLGWLAPKIPRRLNFHTSKFPQNKFFFFKSSGMHPNFNLEIRIGICLGGIFRVIVLFLRTLNFELLRRDWFPYSDPSCVAWRFEECSWATGLILADDRIPNRVV